MRVLATAAAIFLLAACDTGPDVAVLAPVEASSSAEGLTIEAATAGDETHWSRMTAPELWAHVADLDSTAVVGLKLPGQRNGVDDRGRSLVPKSMWPGLRSRIAALGTEVSDSPPNTLHPSVTLRLEGVGQIEALRRSPFVEFVEPASFDPADVLMSGCGPASARHLGGTSAARRRRATSYRTRSRGRRSTRRGRTRPASGSPSASSTRV